MGALMPLLWTLSLTALLFAVLAPLLSPRTPAARRNRRWHSRAKAIADIGFTDGAGRTGAALSAYVGLRGDPVPPDLRRSGPSRRESPTTRPSVLLIAIDSLRADRLDGSERSRRLLPALSGLAGRSVAFDSARVTVPRTFPLAGHAADWALSSQPRHSHDVPDAGAARQGAKALPACCARPAIARRCCPTSAARSFPASIWATSTARCRPSTRTIVLQRA